jgi:hypothetical protein|nr:MAG TPA_asm: hypothetical protein [Caudoviricetes sp.]
MLGNDDNSNIEINVNKGGNGMSDGTVTIARSEYKSILELAYKAAMLKEAMFNAATDFYGNDIYFGSQAEVATILKYAFPKDYESKLRELMDKKKADDGKEGADDER